MQKPDSCHVDTRWLSLMRVFLPSDWWFEGVSGAEGGSGQQIFWQASFLPIMLITSHSVWEQSLICKRQTFTLRYLWAWCSVGARRQSGHWGRSLCGQQERYNNSLIPAWLLFYYFFFLSVCFLVCGGSPDILYFTQDSWLLTVQQTWPTLWSKYFCYT